MNKTLFKSIREYKKQSLLAPFLVILEVMMEVLIPLEMAKIIDDETMENVCILAKLSLSGQEREKAKADMQKMLDYVDKLNELDTSKVEPMTHIFEMGNVFREDEVTNGDDRDAMLANAPEVKEGQYKVPKTVE